MMRSLAEKKAHLKEMGETVIELEGGPRRHRKAGTCRMTESRFLGGLKVFSVFLRMDPRGWGNFGML